MAKDLEARKRAAQRSRGTSAARRGLPVKKKRQPARSGMKNANAGKAKDSTVKSPEKRTSLSTRSGMKNANAGKAKDSAVKSPGLKSDGVLEKMGRNSTNWSFLEETKGAAKAAKWPQAAQDRIAQKQQERHAENVKLGAYRGYTFDETSGTWSDSAGKRPYSPQKALPIRQQTGEALSKLRRDGAAAKRKNEETLRRKTLPIAQERSRAARAKAANAALAALGKSARRGLHEFNANFYSTADALIPDNVPFLSDAVKSAKADQQKRAEDLRESAYQSGSSAGVASDIGAAVFSSLPNLLATIASGGTSEAAQLSAAIGGKSGQILNAAKGLAKNPATYLTASQIYGPEYEKAKKKGATDAQAAATALMSTLFQSAVEMSGGIETLGKKSADGLKEVAKTALQEGGEEIAQDLISGALAKETYDKNRALYGTGDSEAVINPQRMATEGAMGALVGGLYGGGHAAAQKLLSRIGMPGMRKATPEQAQTEQTQAQTEQTQTEQTQAERPAAFSGSSQIVTNADIREILNDPQRIAQLNAQGANIRGSNAERQAAIRRLILQERAKNPVDTQTETASAQTETPDKTQQTLTADAQPALPTETQQTPSTDTRQALPVNTQTEQVLETQQVSGEQIREILNDPQKIAQLNEQRANVRDALPITQTDPGILKQGSWKEGEVKPRLRAEEEVRPENTVPRSAEEEAMLQAQLEAYLKRQQQTETQSAAENQTSEDPLSAAENQAIHENQTSEESRTITENPEIEGSEDPQLTWQVGDEVFADDRGNRGVITHENADGTYRVKFTNQETGAEATVSLPGDQLQRYDSEVSPPAAEQMQEAQDQLGALESDSYNFDPNTVTSEDYVRVAKIVGRRIAKTKPTLEPLVNLETFASDSGVDPAAVRSAYDLANSEQVNTLRFALFDLKNNPEAGLSEKEIERAIMYARKIPFDSDEELSAAALAYARIQSEYDEAMKPIRDIQRQIRESRMSVANNFAADSFTWKDSLTGLQHSIQTPERVIENVCGENADVINSEYIAPVHAHEAARIRYVKPLNEKLKAAIKGITHETSVYAHMQNRLDWLLRVSRNSGGRNEAIGQLRMQMARYAEKNEGKIQFDRVEKLENDCIKITREIFPDLQMVNLRNGYDVPIFLDRYIPSGTPVERGGRFARFLRSFTGVELSAEDLPTSIAGTTETRLPGRRYFSALNHRTGMNLDFDMVKAVQNYIDGASDLIFHTDDIQNLRALEDQIRYNYSDEATRAAIDAANATYKWDVEKRVQAKSAIYEATFGNLPNFPTWLREYTNSLAAKKQIIDRGAEHAFGRRIYTLATSTERAFARSMLGGSPSVAISNIAALAQGSAELRPDSMARAMLQYGNDCIRHDSSFRDSSDFLTNRAGADAAYKGKLESVTDLLFVQLRLVDDLASNILVRARYYDNQIRGMSDEAALKEANDWSARLMGDRSKGAAPLLFQSKNPFVHAATMFGLEPTNTIFHVFHDLPREAQKKGAAWLVGTLSKLFVMSYLFNDLDEKITGNRPIADPVGILNNFCGKLFGFALPNTFDLIGSMMAGDVGEKDFQAEKTGAGTAVLETLKETSGYIPGVGNVLGSYLGASSTRFPIEAFVPDSKKLAGVFDGNGTEASRKATLIEEVSKPFLGFLPGGMQLRKTLRGARMLAENGSYSYDQNGERELRFPAYGENPTTAQKIGTAAKALLFGPNATAQGRQWVESGFKSGLDAEGTKAYKTLIEKEGIDQGTAAMAVRALSNSQVHDGETNIQAKRRTIMSLNIPQSAKEYLDRYYIGSDNGSVSYENREDFQITNRVKAAQQEAALSLAHENGLTADQVIDYALQCDVTTNENGDPKTDSMLKAVNLITQDDDLSDEQKNAVAEKLLLPKMGEGWNSDAAKKYLAGIPATKLVYFKYEASKISEDVDADNSIRKDDKSDYKNVRSDSMIQEAGLSFDQEQALRFFMFGKSSLATWQWSDVAQEGADDEKPVASALEQSGLDQAQYQIIKSGLYRIHADKDSNGEAISGTAKKKKIAYLAQWNLTDEQRNLIMKAIGYKYGMGEKNQKTKKSSGISKSSGRSKSSGGSKGSGGSVSTAPSAASSRMTRDFNSKFSLNLPF